MESMVLTVLLPIFIASLVVFFIHPQLVKIAQLKMIVDNPNARKLNKEPVPVLGGVGIFFGAGIIIALFEEANDRLGGFIRSA